MTVLAEGIEIRKDADSGLDVASWNAANPLHPRGGDGKFRDRLVSAVRHIAESWGEIVNHEEFGEPDHEFNDHGVMALHDDGWISISRVDTAADQDPGDPESASGNIANLDDEDALVLQERVELAIDAAVDLAEGEHGDVDDDDEENPFPVSVTYGRLESGTAYVALTDTRAGDQDGLQLDLDAARDFADQLQAMREQRSMYSRDKDNPYLVRPLPPDETLLRRKKVSSDDQDDVLLAIVDTPQGRRLRLGLGGGENLPEKSFTGGPGPLVADLGPDDARKLDETISTALDSMKGYFARQQAFFADGGPLDRWQDETPSGQRLLEIDDEYEIFTGSQNPEHGGSRWIMEYVEKGKYGGHDLESPENVHAPAEVYAEYEQLTAEQDEVYAAHGLLNDEGAVFATYEVPTAAGTVTIDLIQWDPGTKPSAEISVRPRGVSAEGWEDTRAGYETYSKMRADQLKRVQKLVREAFVDAEGNPVVKSAGSAPRRADNDRIAREGRKYWTRNPKGLAKWARSAHPWTKLYRHLVTKMDPETARRLTSSYFKAVFGYAPSARQGKNPVGKG